MMMMNSRKLTTIGLRRLGRGGGRGISASNAVAIGGDEKNWTKQSGFSTSTRMEVAEASTITDQCDRYILKSPYPDIPSGPYEPLAEFISSDWMNRPSKVAITDRTTMESRTFADYHQTMIKFATALQNDFSIQTSNTPNNTTEDNSPTIALFSPNHIDYVPISLAISLTGAKVTPINPLYTAKELQLILEQSQSSVLITHSAVIHTALEAVKGLSSVQHVIVLPHHANSSSSSLPEGTTLFTDILQQYSNTTTPLLEKTVESVKNTTTTSNQHYPVLLPYSSGTTGLPKGVCLSHSNLIANLLQLQQIEEDPYFPPSHKLITPLPFFHIYGFVVSLLYCAWRGQEIITFSSKFDLHEFCLSVQETKPQRAHLVPPIMLGLAKYHDIVDQYDLSSLCSITSAAAPLGSDVEDAVIAKLQKHKQIKQEEQEQEQPTTSTKVVVKQGWGMSELSPLGTYCTDDNTKSGSVGPVVSSTEAKIIDPQTGISLPSNQSGELLIRGPQVMMGYLHDHTKTLECLSPTTGWLRTGDIAQYDENGYVYITDRLKELIKVRGYQVAPAELEDLLLKHDHVKDVAVIGIPDEDGLSGELPRAYIVLNYDIIKDDDDNDNEEEEKEEMKQKEEEIKQWVKERVAPFKRLDGGIEFRKIIPKSASGKILRRLLRDEWSSKKSSS